MKTDWSTICEVTADETDKLFEHGRNGHPDIDTNAVAGGFRVVEAGECGGAHWCGPWCTRARVHPGGDMTFTDAVAEALRLLRVRRAQWHRMLQD